MTSRPCFAAWRRRQDGGGRRLGRGRGDCASAEDPPGSSASPRPRAGRPPSLRVPTPQAAAGALTGRGGPGNKDAIMNVPCGGGGRSPRGPQRGKGGRAGRPRAEPTAETRAGAAPRPTVCAPRGARWRPASVAPRQPSYLFLPGPFPPPSWCGTCRLGDAHGNPAGRASREPLCALPLPPAARSAFPPGNRGPRSLGRGVSFIRTVPEPALASR